MEEVRVMQADYRQLCDQAGIPYEEKSLAERLQEAKDNAQKSKASGALREGLLKVKAKTKEKNTKGGEGGGESAEGGGGDDNDGDEGEGLVLRKEGAMEPPQKLDHQGGAQQQPIITMENNNAMEKDVAPGRPPKGPPKAMPKARGKGVTKAFAPPTKKKVGGL